MKEMKRGTGTADFMAVAGALLIFLKTNKRG
jgi:hypothetical protein